jgi:hypothetical protein
LLYPFFRPSLTLFSIHMGARMHRNFKHFFLNLLIVMGLMLSSAVAQEREGLASGLFYSSATVKNGWYESAGGLNARPADTESSVNLWYIPLFYGKYNDDVHMELNTEFGGFYLMSILGNESMGSPTLDNQDKLQYTNYSVLDVSIAVNIIDLGLPLFVGGQGGLGYMGIFSDGSPVGSFEKQNYASYGANVATMLEMGEQAIRAAFYYNWISMGKESQGKGIDIRLEYYPFSGNDNWSFMHVRAYYETATLPYAADLFNEPFEYTDTQMGIGLIINNIF